MSASVHLALEGGEHLLGAATTFVAHWEQRVADVEDVQGARHSFVIPAARRWRRWLLYSRYLRRGARKKPARVRCLSSPTATLRSSGCPDAAARCSRTRRADESVPCPRGNAAA